MACYIFISMYIVIITQLGIIWWKIINKSPKGHWSLTWVQWALLLKVRFLSKSESTTAIFFEISQNSNNRNISIQDTGMHSVCCCCIPIWRRSSLEKEPLIDLFLANCPPPPLDPPLGGVCRKAYKQVRDYEYFISIKFCKHPSSGSVAKADYVFQYIYMH